jgi:8-oxo-dGTP pyrophosphatase MutT (NUDIX family)
VNEDRRALRRDVPDLLLRARSRLMPVDMPLEAMTGEPRTGDHMLNPGQIAVAVAAAAARPAAVLVPLVARPEGVTVLLTERAASLRSHSGQIAFPGGSIDGPDETPVEAALREAEEEIGLDPSRVRPFGRLDDYLSGSGFRIVPIVAEVLAPFSLTINEAEVADVFEVPLDFLMDAANHQRQSREWKGIERHYYAMPWRDRFIWGVTAGIIRNFYERLDDE